MIDFESRAPDGYICPICAGLHQDVSETHITPDDIVYTDDLATALINSFFQRGNEGHVIVVPNTHYESTYDLPREEGHRIFDVAQKIARAMKLAYSTDGITLRQNNEPAGDQHAFHYHLHAYPRYEGDSYNEATAQDRYLANARERADYAKKLRLQMAGEDNKPAGAEYSTS
jgi:histidine triad (HIT) family protein